MTGFRTEDVPYRTIEGSALLVRLYIPEGAAAAPWVVDAHGGAWGSGDRLNNRIIHEDFAGHGIGVCAVDFRLSSQARFPGPVQDVNYAVRWFKANAAGMGVTPAKVGGLGSSSGAQQMGLVAFRPDDPLYAEPDAALAGVDARLDFFLACWPILDPMARYRMAQDQGKARLVAAHDAYFPDEAAMESGNPYAVVARGEATAKPPMIVVQGTADENVEHGRADIFAEAYRAFGGSIKVLKYEGQPHTFITANEGSEDALKATAALRDFVLAQQD